MPSTLAYTRKFIILKKEYSTIPGRNLKGHSKLEIKGLRGIVTVNIENAEVDSSYNVAFISADKSNPIWDLGRIFTDDIGRGKGEYTFTQRDLEAKNFSMDKISGILIMKDENILLGGYIDKEDNSIERYIESLPFKEQVQPMEEPILESEEVTERENVEVAYEPAYDIPAHEPIEAETMYDIIQEEPATEEPEIKETQEIESLIFEQGNTNEIITEEVNPREVVVENVIEEDIVAKYEYNIEDLDEESMEPDYKTLDYIRKLNQKNQTINYVLSILRFFPYIDPFKYNLKGYNWWIVELDKENEYRSFLPYFSYITGGNNKEPYNNNITTCNQLMNKYQHYLFGLYNEGESVKYFIYGIPGNFTTDEHPYRGVNGFNTWYQGKNEQGYWIIFIDPMTGKPIDIQTPMIPVE